MKLVLSFAVLSVLLAVCSCEDSPSSRVHDEDDETVLVEADIDHSKPLKRQIEGRAIGTTTQHIYGSAPGHYVLRTASNKEAESEPEADYLTILRQIESGNLQSAAAQARPTIQQYLIPRPQPTYATAQTIEPKLLQVQPQHKRPLYAFQPQYQAASRIPLVLRPSQAVKPTPVHGIYTSQGFVATSPNHALHEARVQAALSVADDKQSTGQSQPQSVFQFATKPQSAIESSFEKELAQLVAANQAAELKVKPSPQPVQYYQQVPQPKPTYSFVPAVNKQKQYAFLRPESQAPKYAAPVATARTKTPQKLPQQYLIETTKPQPQAPVKQVVVKPKPQPQYIQVTTEEPKYYEYQPYQQEKLPSAIKTVSAPQFHQSPVQYKQYSQKEAQEAVVPNYLQYYQAIRPQQEEITSSNDVKLDSYVSRFASVKQAPSSTPSPSEERPTYITKYQAPAKAAEEANNYVRYKAVKPTLTTEFASDDDALLQAFLAQTLQKTQQGLSSYTTTKTASSEAKPQISPASESHSSIFVSKALAPKKKLGQKPTVEAVQESDNEGEIQTVRLPPPKNNKVYTQDEFQALLAAGYSVTPVPVLDDEDSSGKFSPAPENYPGHSKYQSAAPELSQVYQKESSENYSTATQAPRTRKVQRRRPVAPRYRYQSETIQAEEESQPQLSYAYPLEAQESSSYGLKKQTRSRVRPSRNQEESDS